MVGIVFGIVGMEGRGGKFSFGRLGMVGMLGRGGKVGLGSWEGCVVGNVGKGGKFSIEGNGGNLGKFGVVVVCKSWRPAKPTLILLKNAKPAKHKAKKKEFLRAMAQWNSREK